MDFVDNLPPVREFFDLDAEALHTVGRVTIRDSYGLPDLPIVVKCRTISDSGHGHAAVYGDVGFIRSENYTEVRTIPARGKTPAKEAEFEGTRFTVVFRQWRQEQILTDKDMTKEQVFDYACKMALAAYGKEFNYIIDLMHQPVPTIAQRAPVLLEFGLIDPKRVPKPRPKRQQSHGGRGSNKATVGEIEELTGAKVG